MSLGSEGGGVEAAYDIDSKHRYIRTSSGERTIGHWDQQLSMVEGTLTDPETNKQGMQVMGRPPDKTGMGLVDQDAMEMETSGDPTGGCCSFGKHGRC